MNPFIFVIIITAVAGIAGTGAGGIAGVILGRDSQKTISLLLSFAGGVMLAVVCFSLLPEAMECAPDTLVFSGVLLGFFTVYLLNSFIDKTEKLKNNVSNTAKSGSAYQKQSLYIGGLIMASAIALHNLPEGMVIGAAYAKSAVTDAHGFSELAVAAAIGLHNIPEGMAIAVPMLAGGSKKGKAVFITALSGAPTVIGAIIGYLLGTLSDLWLALSLSFASGAMLYVVFGELLPDSVEVWKSKATAVSAVLGLLVGILIV